MSRLKIRAILFVFGATAAVATSAGAQSAEPPADVSHQVGPLAFSPTFRLTDLGHDSNVYNETGNTRSDMSVTASPAIGTWLRLPAVRIAGRSQVDFVYFRRLTELRAVDRAFDARAEVPLRRFTPYFSGVEAVTRDGRNFEIDTPVRRWDRSLEGGLDVRLTGKVTVGGNVRRSRVNYEGDIVYLASISEVLNRKADTEGVRFRYALTPLTSVGVTAERQRDRYTSAPGRDARSMWVMPEVEFQPAALIRGRAQIGVRSRSYDDARAPEYHGTSARVDLGYTLLGRTSFGVVVQRDLEDSYLAQTDYVLTGGRLEVLQKLAEPWEVGASVSRYRLHYRSFTAISDQSASFADEAVINIGAEIGYRTGRSRLGLQVDYGKRPVDPLTLRGYERLRLVSSISHDF